MQCTLSPYPPSSLACYFLGLFKPHPAPPLPPILSAFLLSSPPNSCSPQQPAANMPQAPSTRWCPTPEQLMILEEMYRSGIRTPNATQIQQITAHLSYYGKIEGKNVFYWFQNHKARERQKLRRRLSRHQQFLQQQQQQYQGGCSQLPVPHLLSMELPPAPPLPPPFQLPARFFQQGAYQEPAPALNLMCKMETYEGALERTAMNSGGFREEWMVALDVGGSSPPCCRPLKTLDLFPTRSTGLKEECNTSKSSSCSTSTTN